MNGSLKRAAKLLGYQGENITMRRKSVNFIRDDVCCQNISDFIIITYNVASVTLTVTTGKDKKLKQNETKGGFVCLLLNTSA